MNRLRQLELIETGYHIGEQGLPIIDLHRTGHGPFDIEGTLLVVISSAYTIEGNVQWDDYNGERVQDRHQGVLIIGGLAFIEGVQVGTNLEGRDPTPAIEQTCLMLAGKDFDRDTPDLEAWRIRAEEQRRARIERNRIAEDKRKKAAAKALAILTEYLSEEQRVEFETTGDFTVIGADGYQYLITSSGHHNVFRIEDGKKMFMYCIVCRGFIPKHDQMLAQMFLLQANPTMFHETTNTWGMGEDGTWKMVKRGQGHVIENIFEQALQDIDL